MDDIGPRAKLDAFLATIPAVTGSTTRTRKSTSRNVGERITLNAVGAVRSPACDAVLTAGDRLRKQIANGPRHAAALAPLMNLISLARQGHAGIAETAAGLREEFIATVGPDRAHNRRDGSRMAADEWDRALAGALSQILAGWVPDPYALCDCALEELEIIAATDTLFEPRRRRSQQNVYRACVRAARLSHSRKIRESVRQIAEAAQVGKDTTQRTLHRLETLGLVEQLPTARGDTGQWLLRTARTRETGTASLPAGQGVPPPPAGPKAVPNTRVPVHPLFGPRGLSGGHRTLWEQLPELWIPGSKGYFVSVAKGTHELSLNDRVQRDTGLGSSRAGRGLTVNELAERMDGRAKATIRKQLNDMAGQGMAIKWDGRWHRCRVADADALLDYYGIPDTRITMRERHNAERVSKWRRRAQLPDGHPDAAAEASDDAMIRFVHRVSGELAWSVKPGSTVDPGSRVM